MTEHPIEGLMTTAMNNIKDMVDVNTIIGDPIQASNNTVIIPISRVSFGFEVNLKEKQLKNIVLKMKMKKFNIDYLLEEELEQGYQ